MRIERLAAISEIVSSIAIVATLAYLAVQTQQNTKTLQASARQASLDSELGLIYSMIENPVLYTGPLIELSDADYTEREVIQITMFEIASFRARENFWLQYQDGALAPEVWESYRSVLVDSILNFERTQKVWNIYVDQFDSGFAAEVNSLLVD